MQRIPDLNGRFLVTAIDSPGGYRPGRYFFVYHVGTGHKVSRYMRRPMSAARKAARYERMYEAGDRYWPEVTRCDELRTNPDALPSIGEKLAGIFGLNGCLE
jgi:hypothetical protein